ncbi:transmembrane protein 131 isoform X1 [Seriola lalandi dorsalis]|uniref:transmembrane protein 131 isoform X1 n=1 Tax=Seriola lalandi dorsalis TaxID=1841481 RepID=UPI000C6F8171|nr:transmembrane protein 131 isoform X1 [Seriola lalandi dorsalis]XP_056234606.1 transmembrane protein 131 isoform X3 [Seriola aureovittata]
MSANPLGCYRNGKICSMASQERAKSCRHTHTRTRTPCIGFLRMLFIAFIHTTRANKQAFIQSDTILEVLHFGEGSLLQAESDIDFSLYHQQSTSPHRGNCRPIRFEPPMLDFHEQPVGMPKMEKVYLHNPSSEEISLISISATTAHFHASFFQNRIIPPGGNTSFDVVFLARVVGNVENTLFINTSHHGVFTYQVFGVGIPNPYRLRPFIGARVPVNSSFSPLINIHNPYSEPLQVVEMYSSGGDLHLELPTGQQGGTGKLWEIPPFETKGVMRASFSSRDVDNHTAFIRIKTNAPNEDQFIILPVEVEVTSAPGIYSSTEMLDFGTLRSQDRPKLLNLHLLNSGTKDVPITSVRTTPSNEAVTVDFKAVTLKAGESRYTKVASITFDASKARRPYQFSGKITVKAKEKSYSKLEIPYQAEVLEGYLGFDHTATLFHIRDSPVDPVDRPVFLTNAFNFAIRIHNVSLPEEAKTMFNVQNFSAPILIPPHESRYIFSLLFRPVRPSIHIDSNILLVTNASKFHLPVRAYTGFLEPLVLPPSLTENLLDFGVRSATDTSSITFVVVNSNPIELEIKSWLVTGDSLSMELLKTEKGNTTVALSRLRELQNTSASHHKTVILASGYYAAFRVTLVAKALEGAYDGAVHITTDYEILTIPVKALIAVGTLNSSPKHIVLPPSFPGKVVHQSFSIQSSFTQKVRLQQIRSLTEDIRFYYKRLRNNKDELEPRRKSKVANIYFDASLQCGDHCYVGLPFVLKSESKPHGLALQEDIWDADVDLHQKLLRRWKELKERAGHKIEAIFEVNTDLQKNVQAKITAHLTWPSLVNSSQRITFPLTNTNSSSDEEVILQNPADVPVYVQVLPLALLPNPSVFSGKLADRFPLGNLSNINIDTNTFEFQVHRNQTSLMKTSTGFAEGSTRPFVYNLVLLPGEVKSFSVRFTPISNHSVSSLLIVRNNLTVIDTIVLHGRGATESLKVAGKPPGQGSSLRFKMTEALLKDCTEKTKVKEPNFTLKRTFRVENTGLLPITIRSAEINGQACEGYGFKVLNCQEFALKPNASKDLIILFTPDFTSSRVIRELKLVTCGGSEFVFVLNASLPYHMLAACAETLPRPSWELELYIIVSLIMSSMFLLVIATAYLEAQSIWEPFKRRVSVESNSTLETGRPFNLRDIVQIHSDSNDSPQNSRGLYASSNGAARPGGRQANSRTISDSDSQDKRSRIGFSRPPMQATSSQLTKGSTTSGQEGPPAACQLTNRKARSTKQLDLQSQTLTVSPLPHRGLCPEEAEYANLIGAMDNDLDRPESLSAEALQEQSVQNKVLESKGKLRGKTKAQRKKEEKEKKSTGKTQGDELKDNLADNDDSSSTTTETSNPDVETNIREEPVKKKGRTVTAGNVKEETSNFSIKPKTKKQGTTKKEAPAEKSSSLELPYVTPLENKQRKSFTSKNLHPLAAIPKTKPLQKQRLDGNLEDGRPSLLAKLLSSSSVPEPGHSSSSEGEKDFASPEWDVPLTKNSIPEADSLQQISLQTINADPFLKRSATAGTGSPPPTSPSILSRGTYSSVLNSNSEGHQKKAPGNKLSTATPLPGKNGNPTFAAVAAGYDKSPGGSGPGKTDSQGKSLAHMTSVESDSSDSSGLWSPIDTASSPNYHSANSFSAFGPNNSFNLTGVFSGMNLPKSSEPQQSWPEFTTVPSSIWDIPNSDSLHSWPSNSSSPTAPTASLLGNTRNPWSTTTPFGSSIWSTSADSALHPFAPTTNTTTLTDLVNSSAPSPPASTEMSRTYNPWSMWRPTLSRRSSEPWPSSPDNGS